MKYKTAEIKMLLVRETENTIGAVDRPERIVRYWNEVIAGSSWYTPDKEQVVVVALDTKFNPIGFNLVSMGTVNETMCHPRDVFRPAIHMNATSVVLIHNHPSGDPAPSAADFRLTRAIKEAGELLRVNLTDHIVVGNGSLYYSFRESGIV